VTRDDALAEVRDLIDRRAQVDSHIRRAIQVAKDAGCEITEIAAAAGVGRQTIYRWLETPSPVRVDVAEVIDDALARMIGHVGPGTIDQLTAGLRSDQLDVKIRRFRLGVRNVQPGTLDPELRAILGTASEAIAAAERTHERSRVWPSTIALGTGI
jgi:AcrR family transcriptional regulator